MTAKSTDPTIKIVVFGSSGVGKSEVVAQFFPPETCVQEGYYRKIVTIDDEAVMLEVLEYLYGTQYWGLREANMQVGDGFVLVYSITAPDTFLYTSEIFEQICSVKQTCRIPVVLVGNKCDLTDQRVVTTEEGQALAAKCGPTCLFMEASATQKKTVEKIFFDLVRHIRKLNPPKQGGQKHQCQIL